MRLDPTRPPIGPVAFCPSRLVCLLVTLVGTSCLPQGSVPGPRHASERDVDQTAGSTADNENSSPSQGLPASCQQQGMFCAPRSDFVERLCGNKYPGLAIVWFARGSPWTRHYVRQPVVEPRNTTGGPSSDTKLTWGEEVLVLKQHGGGGSVKVSGAVDYDVLRWDGTCALMSELEMTSHAPGVPKNAPIVWRHLDTSIQQALLKDSAIEKAQAAETKACGGKAAGAGYACEQADRNLNNAIVAAVRKGIELPKPDRIP